MQRRTVLTGLAALSASVAGCGGDGGDGSSEEPGGPDSTDGQSGPDPSESLTVPDFNFEEGSGGNSIVALTVANEADRAVEATMTTKIRDADDASVSEETTVSIPAGGEETYRVEFEVPWSWFDENRNLQSIQFE